MPAIPIPVQFARVTLRWQNTGVSETSTTQFDIEMDNVISLAELQAISDNIHSTTAAGLLPGCSDEFSLIGNEVVGNIAGSLFVVENTDVDVGGESFPSAPPNVAMLVKKSTGMAGRAFRGRLYMPSGFLPEGGVTSAGFLTPTLLNDWQTGFDAWLTAINGITDIVQMVILHGPSVADPTPPYTVPTPVTRLLVENEVATQRRRLMRGS